jgi:hypothetical protein
MSEWVGAKAAPSVKELTQRVRELEEVIERLSAPVSRHSDADGILQRYFITGGRQYRYTQQDAIDLEALVGEFVAARKTAQ